MDNRPIGVFDSGLGGLTAVKELIRLLPDEDIVYFGDTGRVPYGTRGAEIIEKYALQDVKFLKMQDVKFIIAACGTVSSVALDKINNIGVPVIGVVEHSAYSAVKSTKNKKIGVIGTAATIRSQSYGREIKKLMPDAEIFSAACPLFVPLVENGFIDKGNQISKLATEHYLAPIKAEGVDTLILGCTHFPLLRPFISEYMGEGVTLINTGEEVAKQAAQMLGESGLFADGSKKGEVSFFVSDSIDDFSHMAEMIFESDSPKNVNKVRVDTL